MPRSSRNSRQAILHAAAAEFAARGFAGARVDRIARDARVNKAMIYYHFGSKARLYLDIVGDMLSAVSARTGAVAASPLAPADKLDAFVEALAAEAAARPHFPPMMMREVAEGAPRLDPDTLRRMLGIITSLQAILDEGVRRAAFTHVDPVIVYFTLFGPIVVYLGSAPVRQALGRLARTQAAGTHPAALSQHLTGSGDISVLVSHLKATIRLALARKPAPAGNTIARRPRRTGSRHPAGQSGAQA